MRSFETEAVHALSRRASRNASEVFEKMGCVVERMHILALYTMHPFQEAKIPPKKNSTHLFILMNIQYSAVHVIR